MNAVWDRVKQSKTANLTANELVRIRSQKGSVPVSSAGCMQVIVTAKSRKDPRIQLHAGNAMKCRAGRYNKCLFPIANNSDTTLRLIRTHRAKLTMRLSLTQLMPRRLLE